MRIVFNAKQYKKHHKEEKQRYLIEDFVKVSQYAIVIIAVKVQN